MKMKLFVSFLLAVFASEKEETVPENGRENGERYGTNAKNPILVKIEEDEYSKLNKKSKYIGVSYHKLASKWSVQRKRKNEKVHNGYYEDEETAAHASDTLARKLMKNGKQKLKLNFPDDHTEVYPGEKTIVSKFIGVSYNKNSSKWCAARRSKYENKTAYNGCYDDEETTAHASDTLARKLMDNGQQNHKLNFPDDHIEVYPEKKNIASKFIGVFYYKSCSKWCVGRWNKNENKNVYYGYYDDEETAAHASDTLARKLMENGKQKLKLNFPDNHTEVYPKENGNMKRKRPKDLSLEHSQNN